MTKTEYKVKFFHKEKRTTFKIVYPKFSGIEEVISWSKEMITNSPHMKAEIFKVEHVATVTSTKTLTIK